MIKKFVPVVTILFLSIIGGIVFRSKVPDCGLAEIKNVNDIRAGTVTLSYALGANSGDESGMTKESFQTAGSGYDVESAAVIAIVEPTGNIRQTEGSIGQEIIFREIIKGDDTTKGNESALAQHKGYVYQYFGFHETDGSIQYMNIMNLMYPGNRYLIFLEASPLNPYLQEPVYILKSDYLGYININGQNTETLASDFRAYDFPDLADYAFFSVSEKITSVLNDIRKEILNLYFCGQ